MGENRGQNSEKYKYYDSYSGIINVLSLKLIKNNALEKIYIIYIGDIPFEC